MLGLAIAITSKAFEEVKDKGGKAYILHCLRVMSKVKHLGENAMMAAVMHDLVEDTDEKSSINWTVEMLTEVGFPIEVVDTVYLLTHTDDLTYDQYIRRLAPAYLARHIKMSDLRDNSDITRLKDVTKKDVDRNAKYHRSYKFLNEYDKKYSR